MADKKTETKKVSKPTTTKKAPISSVKPEPKSTKTKATSTTKKDQIKVEEKSTKVAKKPEAEVKKVTAPKPSEKVTSKPQTVKKVEPKVETKKSVEKVETKKTESKAEAKKVEAKPEITEKKSKSLISKLKGSKVTKEKETSVKEEKPVVKVKKEVKKVKFSPKLPEKLFKAEKIYKQAIFDTILSDRASKRQGTHQVKNRAEVSGSGKKPWRQKGTGRARTGSLRTPVFVGGGRAFGPQSERNYTLKVNKKVRRAAFLSALTLLANNSAVAVDDLKLEKISTRTLVDKLTQLQVNNLRRILIVTEDTIVFKSASNIPNVSTTKAYSLSVELLLAADVMIISNQSLKLLEGKNK